ncbi:hypothetical protein JCM5296_006447 [Sporobolomyces johnsonii]
MAVSTRHALVAEEQEGRSEQELAVAATLALSDPEDTVPDDYRLAGTTSTPRLRRALFFPSSSPSSPSVDRTLTNAPLPPVPLSALRDPVIAGTSAAAPHLFDISTPLKVDVLKRWLAPHPNRDLINSILVGLRQGFWPGFEDLIAMQLGKDFEAGFLSEPFDTLLPGMVVSPTFIVRVKDRKPRAVVDQSASGLNDGVSKEAAGKGRWIYYVDRRVVFGGRFSPRLWCIILNSILWGVRHRLGLEFPLVYVDDTFGYDVSRKTNIVSHPSMGESRSVPSEQAAVLVAWKLLGVPWEWNKQESGQQLVVLGHYVDTATFSISLPPKAKSNFIALVRDFVASKERPLVEWWQLTGYAQWAASTSPFINSKRPPPPLDILDPALEEWGKGEASLVAYSDACLCAEGPVASGLGYWFKVAGEEHRRSYAARISPPLDDIFLAEALAAHAAILSALTSNVAGNRLLLFTNNASMVYALDSGSARPDVPVLIKDTYQRLREQKVDLRLRHIPGYLNTTADNLSRVPLSRLRLWFKDCLTVFNLKPPSTTLSREGESE